MTNRHHQANKLASRADDIVGEFDAALAALAAETSPPHKDRLAAVATQKALQALSLYEQAVKLAPWELAWKIHYEGRRSGLADLLFRMARSPVERPQKLSLLKRMRELVTANLGNVYNPEDSWMLLGKAAVLEAQGAEAGDEDGLLRSAFASFHKAIEMDPGMTTAYDALIDLYAAVGNNEEAEAMKKRKSEVVG